jgi:hypothetical protein
MPDPLNPVKHPELVFGIAGPIGVDVGAITESIETSLKGMGYRSERIKLTDEMFEFRAPITEVEKQDFYNITKYKMDYANAICKYYKDRATLASVGIRAIHNRRRAINESKLEPDADIALDRTAFIIRQLKRPEEVELLRKVYGRQFILVSAYGPLDRRKAIVESTLRRTLPLDTTSSELAQKVEYLISRDASEDTEFYGQHLRDTFHLADVFVDGIDKQEMQSKVARFIFALFGRTDVAPSKEEHGM